MRSVWKTCKDLHHICIYLCYHSLVLQGVHMPWKSDFFFPVLKYGIFFPVPTILCRCVSLQTYLIAKCIGGFFHIYLLVDVIITIPYVSFLLSNQYFLLLFKLIWKSYLFWFQHLKVTPNLNIWISPLRANSTKWSNTLKQFVGKLPTNYLSVFWPFCGIGP